MGLGSRAGSSSIWLLISIKKNDYTTAGGDSQKIYEYMATGKPIVTTSVPPAAAFSDVLYIADDKAEFAALLRKALDEDDQDKRIKRTQIADENSWARRVDCILNKVRELI